MRHLDLFSGIGGFALAAEMVWDDINHIFCDNDPFSQAVLRKHWPNSLIYGDIRELTQARIATDTEVGSTRQGIRTGLPQQVSSAGIDIVTGGFPCQPFSSAGRRLGTEDDRHLWPEMLRIIRETNPTWVVGENVGGFLTWDGGMVFEQVCFDLEEAGYEVCPFVIPAVAVGAPHRRDRVWVVAHADRSTDGGTTGKDARSGRARRIQERHAMGQLSEPGTVRDASDAKGGTGPWSRENATGHGGKHRRTRSEERGFWTEDWHAVASRLCAVDDGIPRGLVRPKGWRNAALKAAGNAIVPQVAAQIMRGISEANAALV